MVKMYFDYGKKRSFLKLIKKEIHPYKLKDVIFLENTNLAILKTKNDAFKPLGCPTCFKQQVGQDKMGIPTINGKKLIPVSEDLNEGLTEITANIWLCPQCKMPKDIFLPAFQGMSAQNKQNE